MAGRTDQLIYLAAAAVAALGLLRLYLRFRWLRRMVDDAPPEQRRAARRQLNRTTAAFVGVLLAGAIAGLVSRSLAWGLGTVVVLAVAGLFAGVVWMLVVGLRGGHP